MSFCSSCARWTIAIISICILICTIISVTYSYIKKENEQWSKIIRKNLVFWIILSAMVLACISSIIGLILCCTKNEILSIICSIIIIIAILSKLTAVILSLFFKNIIVDIIDLNWENPKIRNSRQDLEKYFECCGLKEYNPTKDCGIKGDDFYPTCEKQVEKYLDKYLREIRIFAIAIISIELILLICSFYIACCNFNADHKNNELDNSLIFTSLIN